jgi:DNA-binding XRE family transcriptional regulator
VSHETPPTPHETQFGARLRAHRLSQGLSAEKAAHGIGCHAQTLRNWERGHTKPPLTWAGSIARALSIPVDALFTDDVVLSVVVSSATLERCRTEGRTAAADAAQRLAAMLEPQIYAAATKPARGLEPGARAKPRQSRAERLASLKAAHGKAARRTIQ